MCMCVCVCVCVCVRGCVLIGSVDGNDRLTHIVYRYELIKIASPKDITTEAHQLERNARFASQATSHILVNPHAPKHTRTHAHTHIHTQNYSLTPSKYFCYLS